MKRTVLAGAAALAFLTPAFATSYHIVDLGSTTSRAINARHQLAGEAEGSAALYTNGHWVEKRDRHHNSVAFGIDKAGDMTGQEWDGHNGIHPTYYPRGGRGYDIPLPGGIRIGDPVQPGGISPDGTHVVGVFHVSGEDRCFLWTPGDAASVDIGVPADYAACEADGVNDAGEIVGKVFSESLGFSGFVYQGGTFTLVAGGRDTSLLAVNAEGHACGTDSYAQAFFWNGRHLKNITSSGSLTMNAATALNRHDDVVGWGSDGGVDTVLMYSRGTLVDLGPLIDDLTGWDFSQGWPTGISDDGWITGFAFRNRSTHAYLLIPQ